MNEMQQEAVFTVNGPVLVLAGAGSGKTTVIVNRIANMINFGNAYLDETGTGSDEDIAFLNDYAEGKTDDFETLRDTVAVSPIKPWNILAITFTNKAAGELKERLSAMLGDEALKINASTFHSACVRILRREITALGYGSDFTIYDSDDSQRMIKSVMTELDISEKQFAPKAVLSDISRAKDKMTSPETLKEEAGQDYRKKVNRYVEEHKDNVAIYKLNHNLPLSQSDYDELERIFTQELGSDDDYKNAYGDTPFGLLVRKIAKLDHESAMAAFSSFINDSSLNQRQIEFILKIINHIENNGYMTDVTILMKPPFDKPTRFTKLFDSKTRTALLQTIENIKNNALQVVA